jgi:hypothetical protein
MPRTIGEYNFAGQYQQMPALQGGGMVKSSHSKMPTRGSSGMCGSGNAQTDRRVRPAFLSNGLA